MGARLQKYSRVRNSTRRVFFSYPGSMPVTEPQAVMPQTVITDEMLASMAAKAGASLRIDHSVNNELASRIAVTKFAGGIGDINPLWTDEEYARRSPYG